MGKIRARTDEELAARKQEILSAARDLLMTMSYESITLAAIAEKTSISRPSMYHYYNKKECVFVDLIIQEYREWGEQMGPLLERRCSQEEFCQTMTDILWGHETLLKLLSLHLPIWDPSYDDSILRHFAKETLPFQNTLKEVVAFQFPDAGSKERNMFLIQFSIYCNSLYETKYIAQNQMDAIREMRFLDFIPPVKEICYDGLIKLSAGLLPKE
ncbi:MAG: TetR/AcrR family transcriptional regulator [Oscillospiraceae bacterium]|nr:TetR/AcrR family transcriptional regulator [Oscillospiraceae bacterium]